MLIISRLVFSVVMVMSMLVFSRSCHTFHILFFLQETFQPVHQPYCLQIRIVRIFKGVFHPEIRLSSHVDKQICLGDRQHVCHGRLITVQV